MMPRMSSNENIGTEATSLPLPNGDGKVTTVARSILIAFFNELAGTEGFADIAPRLRKAVLDDGQFNDAAIKAVLFPDGT
jgi:hypothetical protein